MRWRRRERLRGDEKCLVEMGWEETVSMIMHGYCMVEDGIAGSKNLP